MSELDDSPTFAILPPYFPEPDPTEVLDLRERLAAANARIANTNQAMFALMHENTNLAKLVAALRTNTSSYTSREELLSFESDRKMFRIDLRRALRKTRVAVSLLTPKQRILFRKRLREIRRKANRWNPW